VSTYVNSVKHDDPGCQEPATEEEAPPAPKPKKAVDGRQGSLF
jgi:hypothetical protein